MVESSYNSFCKLCNIADLVCESEGVKVVFEFGSRYGEDTIEFAKRYPNAVVYAFECNENTLPECRRRIASYGNITLTPKAISDHDGPIHFYPIDKEKTITTWEDGNQGASSLLKASGKYRIEHYVQQDTVVEGITLQTFMRTNGISSIDVMWMDIQGAEMMALKGLGDRLKDVSVIQTEAEFMEIYDGQPLFDEIKHYLETAGFSFVGFSTKNQFFADAVFINTNKTTSEVIKKAKKILVSTVKRNATVLQRLQRKGLKFMQSLKNYCRFLAKYILAVLLRNDCQFKKSVGDSTPIDVLIPTTLKDLDILEYSVNSVRKNVKHPIKQIFIVAPDEESIREIALKLGCVFVDEAKAVNGLTKKDIHYNVNGVDRSGWLLQQLIKLSADEIAHEDFILVMDSDTIVNRPLQFMFKNKTILNVSDEHYSTYYDVYRKLMGEDVISNKSFVAHNMLFSKQVLKEMKEHIESLHQTRWVDAILRNVDYNDISGFSEYETYGNYLLRHHPDAVKIEYWFNESLKDVEGIEKTPSYYKTISIHSYSK